MAGTAEGAGKLRRWLRSPLLHFFVLGLVVFGLHALLNLEAETSRRDPHLVEITSADIEFLRTNWNRLMGREPTADELERLLGDFIREEVLYREALGMGLDQHDTVIRRRLAQKMDFLFKDLAEMNEPSDEEVVTYFDANAERYRAPATVSFTHVYFSPDLRGDRAFADAEAALADVRARGVDPSVDQDETASLGDRFMLQSYYPRQTYESAAWEFGRGFAAALPDLETGEWHGPVGSGFGLHLVYLHERVEPRLPGLDEVRQRVVTDLLADRRQMVNRAAYAEISSRYTILVEDMPYRVAGESGEETR
jgi:hypothetical protein